MSEVTQYVGARYVPMFADPLNWDISKSYEPLTIVYYNGNSYTSRQSVPENTDINNTQYWALTGNYNAQIEQYRNEVEQLKNEVKPLTNEVEQLKNEVEPLTREKKILFIGDSYGTVTSPTFVDLFANYINEEVINASSGAYGFVADGTKTYYNLLNGRSTDNSITDIIVQGGSNDLNAKSSDIETAINSFISLAKTKCPNAKIYIGFCAWNRDFTYTSSNPFITTCQAYKNCTQYGAIYLNGVENSIKSTYYLRDTDFYHPNEAGAKSIARAFANAYRNGYSETINLQNGQIPGSGGNGKLVTSYFEATRINNNVKVSFCAPDIEWTSSTQINAGSAYLIATVILQPLQAVTNKLFARRCPVVISNGTNSYPGYVYYANLSDGIGIYFEPLTTASVNGKYTIAGMNLDSNF